MHNDSSTWELYGAYLGKISLVPRWTSGDVQVYPEVNSSGLRVSETKTTTPIEQCNCAEISGRIKCNGGAGIHIRYSI